MDHTAGNDALPLSSVRKSLPGLDLPGDLVRMELRLGAVDLGTAATLKMELEEPGSASPLSPQPPSPLTSSDARSPGRSVSPSTHTLGSKHVVLRRRSTSLSLSPMGSPHAHGGLNRSSSGGAATPTSGGWRSMGSRSSSAGHIGIGRSSGAQPRSPVGTSPGNNRRGSCFDNSLAQSAKLNREMRRSQRQLRQKSHGDMSDEVVVELTDIARRRSAEYPIDEHALVRDALDTTLADPEPDTQPEQFEEQYGENELLDDLVTETLEEYLEEQHERNGTLTHGSTTASLSSSRSGDGNRTKQFMERERELLRSRSLGRSSRPWM